MTLEQLIDAAMDGQFYGINIFAGQGEGAKAVLLIDHATARLGTTRDPNVKASVQLRALLEANVRIEEATFVDLLG